MLERVKDAAKWAGALVIALLYFLLRRSQQKTAELKTQVAVSEAEGKLHVQENEMAHSGADYAAKRAEYDRLRGTKLPGSSE